MDDEIDRLQWQMENGIVGDGSADEDMPRFQAVIDNQKVWCFPPTASVVPSPREHVAERKTHPGTARPRYTGRETGGEQRVGADGVG